MFKKLKILIVEDEKIIAKDIESTLKRIGHESAGTVSRGDEAIKQAMELKPDLILMDITLKGEVDGIEAAKIINETEHIPIVYITAHQDEDTIEKSKATNPYGYITKPLDDRDLNTAINSAIYRFDVEKRLKEAEERYFRLSENAVDMIYTEDAATSSYKYVNRSAYELTGYKPSEFYESPGLIERIVHPEWKELYNFCRNQILTGELPVPFEFMIVHKSGKEKWLNQRSVVVKDKKHNSVLIEAIVTDVTERRNHEKQLESTTEKLRALSNYLQKVREEERLHISREIHDELGQDLTVLKMDLSMLGKKALKEDSVLSMKDVVAEMKRINSSIDEIVNKVRKIATDLRPDILDKLGLVEAIEWHSGEFEKRTGIKCSYELCEQDFELNIEKAISMFRVLQETFTNIARHANAESVKVNLVNQNGFLSLTVEDNGKGITEEEIEKSTSLGILGMRERITLLGGMWHIKGSKDKGTKVTINVPLDAV
ncbi:MAG: response regulator [Ignavibacteria bacterium]|nr:response regulator [Ignavibacteria bacterium]